MKRSAAILRLLDAIVVVAAALTLITASIGRLDLPLAAARLRISDPRRPLVALGLVVAARWWVASRVMRPVDRGAGLTAFARSGFIAFFVAWIATCAYFGVRACGGLDSYGYVGAAEQLVAGALREPQPIADLLPFGDAPRAAAPLGFVVGADGRSRVPRFPLGLPAVMALSRLAGRDGPFWTPLVMALAALGCAWAIGRRDGDALSGAFAAAVLAASPTFVNGAIQPMSDVAATAWLLAAVMLTQRSPGLPLLAGLCAGMGVLTRAPLLLAALTLGLIVVWRSHDAMRASAATARLPNQGSLAPRHHASRAVIRFGGGLLALVVVQAALNAYLYGNPARSGYGTADQLLHPGRIGINALTFAKWVTYTHTPLFWAAWIVGGFLLRGRGWILASTAVAAAAVLPYLLYFTWDDWEATRFILPGLALALIVGAQGVNRLVARLAGRWRPLVLLAATLACGAASWTFLARHDVFTLWRAEAKYPTVGAWVRDSTPVRAVVFSGLHSGSLRYYAGRETVRWDETPPGALAPSVARLAEAGYPVFLVLDAPSEADRFTARFRDDLPRITLVPRGHLAGADIYELLPGRR